MLKKVESISHVFCDYNWTDLIQIFEEHIASYNEDLLDWASGCIEDLALRGKFFVAGVLEMEGCCFSIGLKDSLFEDEEAFFIISFPQKNNKQYLLFCID